MKCSTYLPAQKHLRSPLTQGESLKRFMSTLHHNGSMKQSEWGGDLAHDFIKMFQVQFCI